MSHLPCRIGPSVLNADLSQIHTEVVKLLENGADFIHLDVMDGHFVPNMTFGHPVVKCLRQNVPAAFLDMHMMVDRPEQWVEPIADAGGDMYTFHLESAGFGVGNLSRKIRDAGMKVGIAIKPGTDVRDLDAYIDLADMILIMTVEPGFGGQRFMEDMLPKVEYIRKNYPGMEIEVDGGVGLPNVAACAEAGANMIVSGTAIVHADNPSDVISTMRQTVFSILNRVDIER